MRWQAIIVLLTITLSIVIPHPFPMAGSSGQTAIGTLDVCHSGTPVLSSNNEISCVNEWPNRPLPLAQSTVDVANPPFHPYIIAFQDERPPKH